MNLERGALIAEIVSGFAIVVTLVILLFEVRGNTEAVQAATYRDVVESISTIIQERGADADVARVYYAGAAGDELSELDKNRFEALVIANMRRFENAFYQYEIGGIEPAQWAGVQTALSAVVRPPGIRAWWEENHQLYSEGFRELVDELLAE